MDVLPEQDPVVVALPRRMKKGIIIFQKNAELGKVKTRLAASIGDQAAFDAYQVLVNFTHQVLSFSQAGKILFYSSFIPDHAEKEFSSDYSFDLQSGGGLGEKMSTAFKSLFKDNYEKLVVIGTDCAEITTDLIEDAFQSLDDHQVVIGPAQDGGYYLLGMREFVPGVFEDIPWSTDQVTSLTKDYLRNNNISFKLLPTLSDVDYVEDWEHAKSKFLP